MSAPEGTGAPRRSRALLAVAAVLLFGVAALALVLVVTRETPGPGPAPAPAAPAPPQQPISPVQQLLGPPPGMPNVAQPPAPVIQGPPPPRPPEGSWEAVPAVARPSALGPLGGALGRGLNELQPRLSACFDEVTQARYGRHRYSTVQDAEPTEEHGTTILMLQVETLQGEVRIADAPLETRGTASDGLIACAQEVLRGQRFAAPAAQAGSRHRVLFPLVR